MNKRLLILTAAAALLAAPLAVRAAPEGAPPRFSAEDAGAFADARIAGLKAGLKLTATQENNWPALETAIRDIAKARVARLVEWRAKAPQAHEHHDILAALHWRAQLLTEQAGDLEKLSQAAKPLYDTLDDGQKRRFGVLLHELQRGGGHEGFWRHAQDERGEHGPDHDAH